MTTTENQTTTTNNPPNDAETAVLSYHRAWTGNDIDTAMEYVADNIVCQAPGGTLEGKAAYREFLASFAPALTGVPHVATLSDGDNVALFYYPQTETTKTALAGEYFTVADGLIAKNQLAFDRLAYGPPAPPA